MRRVSLLASLSASLVALTVGAVAAASPGMITKSGSFRPQGASVSAKSSASALEKAARAVLAEQVASSGGVELGDPAPRDALVRGSHREARADAHGAAGGAPGRHRDVRRGPALAAWPRAWRRTSPAT